MQGAFRDGNLGESRCLRRRGVAGPGKSRLLPLFLWACRRRAAFFFRRPRSSLSPAALAAILHTASGDGCARSCSAPSATPVGVVISPAISNMSRILVIDDSPLQRTYARLVLEEGGHEVLEASGGEEGLQQVRGQSPDCVLLDLLMPDMSGLAVLRQLQLEGHMMPVIVVTAEDRTAGRTECLAAGAAAVIDKPSNPEQLLHAVSAALSRSPGGSS